ncbi:MAG TPA: hypothetical protein VK447_03850, partial [Myxococcaceae bacterium]|nr:hypothetical protein [Myxococcaceae bacterium]
MKVIYAVGAAGLLLAGGAAGYQLGTWSLTDIRGQLQALEEKGAQADAARVAVQKEIDTKLAARAAEYDRQVAELQAGFAKEKDAMALSLANAQQRLTALQG